MIYCPCWPKPRSGNPTPFGACPFLMSSPSCISWTSYADLTLDLSLCSFRTVCRCEEWVPGSMAARTPAAQRKGLQEFFTAMLYLPVRMSSASSVALCCYWSGSCSCPLLPEFPISSLLSSGEEEWSVRETAWCDPAWCKSPCGNERPSAGMA